MRNCKAGLCNIPPKTKSAGRFAWPDGMKTPAAVAGAGFVNDRIPARWVPGSSFGLPYLRMAWPNWEKAAMRSLRLGHCSMLFSEKKPSSGFSVARHSWAISAQVAS